MKYEKVVLVFPGQGSQYVGMGKDLYYADKHPSVRDSVREVYTKANKILGYRLEDICFTESKFKEIIRRFDEQVESFMSQHRKHPSTETNGINGKKHHLTNYLVKSPLDMTLYIQPAVFTTSYACYTALEEMCKDASIQLNPFKVMGHSLGEYTAAVVSGEMDFETTLGLVNYGSKVMSDAARERPRTKLMAVMDKKELNYNMIENLCNEYGQVFWALINSPRQIVVGGNEKKLREISRKLNKKGIYTKILDLDAAFHTPFMLEPGKKLKKKLDNITIYPARTPIVANAITDDATKEPIYLTEPNLIRREFSDQMRKRVRLKGGVEKVIKDGADLFIEIGPKMVSRFIRETNPNVSVLNVYDIKSLEETVKELRG